MELVTGATGFVGGRLVERLQQRGRPVRALVRDRARAAHLHDAVEIVEGDLLHGRGLDVALANCSVAYYLVHSMEAAGSDEGFAARDRQAAERFVTAAAAGGVERIVYLGGILPRESELSPHLASRLEVERVLLDSGVPATALRASIVIGAGSSSFRLLVRLVERLRFLPLPAWRDRQTRPIAERDVVELLARAPEARAAAGRSLDAVGPDTVSYREVVEAIAEALGVGRTPISFGRSLTLPASAIVSAVTGQPLELVRPLMESLEHDLLPRDAQTATELLDVRPLAFGRAVERALGEWERDEELAAW